MEMITWQSNTLQRSSGIAPECSNYGEDSAREAVTFHEGFPSYSPTPLIPLHGLAKELGLGGVFVKDETHRFGLKAFKALGCSYAMGHELANRLNLSKAAVNEISFAELCSPEVRRQLGMVTFVTATDGNHGLGVSWAAHELGHKAEIFMPVGSARARVESIRELNARCTVTDKNYDDTVRIARDYAAERNAVLIQDTSWPGYTDVPHRIMQGYTTLALEAVRQMRDLGVDRPTHIFLQAGVGSFAGAMLAFFTAIFQEQRPVCVIVEPHAANCLFRSFQAGDGQIRKVTGAMTTIMAGLACGEPSILAWNILRAHADVALSCSEEVAANGMRLLASPNPGDIPLTGGESGAVTAGALEYVMTRSCMKALRIRLGLNTQSRILLICTEGDTNPEMYRRIVRYGHYACTD
ncbi:MAG: diaminopropionate ammonia-lyase [Desulfovibrio sp.]|nr:diaminopropionate ammonia-lyase [Desulfovibrio sp.]